MPPRPFAPRESASIQPPTHPQSPSSSRPKVSTRDGARVHARVEFTEAGAGPVPRGVHGVRPVASTHPPPPHPPHPALLPQQPRAPRPAQQQPRAAAAPRCRDLPASVNSTGHTVNAKQWTPEEEGCKACGTLGKANWRGGPTMLDSEGQPIKVRRRGIHGPLPKKRKPVGMGV
jgi:hypothetical protein